MRNRKSDSRFIRLSIRVQCGDRINRIIRGARAGGTGGRPLRTSRSLRSSPTDCINAAIRSNVLIYKPSQPSKQAYILSKCLKTRLKQISYQNSIKFLEIQRFPHEISKGYEFLSELKRRFTLNSRLFANISSRYGSLTQNIFNRGRFVAKCCIVLKEMRFLSFSQI